MKYNNVNKPLVCMQTTSTCYQSTYPMTVKGVLWHSTGVNNPEIRRYVQPSNNDAKRAELLKIIGKNNNGNDWNHQYVEAGLNAWIGELADGSVAAVQTMPWNYRPWGCGGGWRGSCNDHWIQFEICEDNLGDKNYFNAVYKEACELTAYLCKMYDIDPNGYVDYEGARIPTIICHWDSYQYGCGSGHVDITHWFPKYGKSMATVRKDVAALLAAAPSDEKAVNYTVKITADTLNYRSGASTNYSILGTYKKGDIVSITKEKNNWGFTSKGWISLEYIEKLEEEEEMTQEQFNKMMDKWIADQANKEPSKWSQDARTWAENAKYINGDENGRKMYKKFLTREEFAAVLYRFAKNNNLQ